MATVPVYAGPLTFADVVHVMGDMQYGGQNSQLRLRTVQQQGSTPTSGKSTQSGTANGSDARPDGSTNSSNVKLSEPSSLIQGTQTPTQQTPKDGVTQQGDIEGTVCDCGEIRVPTHFPLWWLAGIPAVCLTGICTKDKCKGPNCEKINQCVPLPGQDANCQTATIPEPASLLLLSSGLAALGAGARRRYRLKLAKQESVATEV
jgi:hypothetical protein